MHASTSRIGWRGRRLGMPPAVRMLALEQALFFRPFQSGGGGGRTSLSSSVRVEAAAQHLCRTLGYMQTIPRAELLPKPSGRTDVPSKVRKRRASCRNRSPTIAAAGYDGVRRLHHHHCCCRRGLNQHGMASSSLPLSRFRRGTRGHVGERYTSSVATDGQRKEYTSGVPNDVTAQSSPPPPSPSASLQAILGISDAQAEIIRSSGQTTKTAFDNLISISDGGARPGASVSFTQSWPPPSSCFPRFLLHELHAAPEDVKSLVLRRPVVLGWSAVAAGKVSLWLQDCLGMNQSEVAQLLLRHPEAGTKSVENTVEPKVEWLRTNLNIHAADDGGVVKLLLHAPQILNLSVERSLDPMLRWLKERLGVSSDEAAKIARENPTLFWLSVDNNLEPTLRWLLKRLDIKDEEIVLAMVAAAPKILSLNTLTGIEPKLAWLRDSLGLNPQDVCEIIRREPTILYKSVDDNLKPKLAWLKLNLDLDDQAAREMFVAFPRMLGSSLAENLKLKVPWLQKSLGLDSGEAVALVKRAPVLLQYSIEENLEPTVSFFRAELGASTEELRGSVQRNPKILAYSLDGRLRPRVAAMRTRGIQPIFLKHLNPIIRWPDSKFQGFLEGSGS
ncbi:unnamed protein product [Ectocarpus sp. 12 AP-2014]